ncbi:DM13 domain-containing protein [Nocardia sp. NPDC060259]|uniref:DM13 domain-containing protein n=1 Tax=Nocardia sp. NPDC060259 TaxID=3347088 RepID=UPI003654880F
MAQRRTRRTVLSVLAVGLVAALAAGLYLFQPWRLFTTTTVDEAPVSAVGTPLSVIATGEFRSHEHDTSGSVQLQRTPEGTLVLRITDLRTSDGPALRVWLTDQPVIADDWHNFDDGTHVDLGALKGNEGNQNYELPAGTDLSTLASVSIWCARFHVSFGAATLTPA